MNNWASRQLGEISQVEKRLKRGGFEYAYLFYHIPEVDDPYYPPWISTKRTIRRYSTIGSSREE